MKKDLALWGLTRAYSTGIPVIFFRYSNSGIDIKIPFLFGTNLKNNCL
jgi:hypothetical protein